ncbi:MAG TPA: hypothetical protein VFU16_06315 [Solirubrobacterales bacterium]|nr:hypothetical protein [Solirubrobacterales bacterium]
MRSIVPFGVPFLASVFGTIGEVRFAIYAMATVFVVLIVLLFILALRGVGPTFEKGKTTRFRLAPIRDQRDPAPPSQDP